MAFSLGFFLASPMYSWTPDLISLQDMCKLYLLATIDEYPVDLLAKLPLSMRKKLFMAMPVIDRLHFVGTVFVDGMKVTWDVDRQQHIDSTEFPVMHRMTGEDSNEQTIVSLYPGIASDDFKQKMINIVLPALSLNCRDCDIKRFCSLNFSEGCFDSFNSIYPNRSSDRVDTDFYYCVKSLNFMRYSQEYDGVGNKMTIILKVDSIIHPKAYSPHLSAATNDTSIIPLRLSKFIRHTTYFYPQEFEFESTHFETFAEYCKLWSWIPKVLEIDCKETILESPLWKYFQTRHTRPDGNRVVYSYLKKLFSSVKTLKLSSTPFFYSARQNAAPDITLVRDLVLPVIRLCAGHNMESRTLKHIEITCTRSLDVALDMLYSIQEFLSCGYTSIGLSKDDDVSLNESSPALKSCPGLLDFHRNEVYPIESFSVAVDSVVDSAEMNSKQEMKNKFLIKIFGNLVAQQLGSLKHVAMKLLIKVHDSCSNSSQPCIVSIDAVTPTLIKLFQQPQFESLKLSVIYPKLLHAFVTTPATQNQLLSIDPPNSNQPQLPDWPRHAPDPSDIPSSNLKFKSLDLGSSDSHWSRQVMATSRILRLKMLHVPVNSLLSVRKDTIIEISHVKIDFSDQVLSPNTSNLEISHENLADLFRHIGLFLQKNLHLSILEFLPCCKLPNLPLLNQCLEQLTQSPIVPHPDTDHLAPITVHTTPVMPPSQQHRQLKEIHLYLDTPLRSYVTGSIPQINFVNDGGDYLPSSDDFNRQQIVKRNQSLLKLFALIRNLGELRVTDRVIITMYDVVFNNFLWSFNSELLRIIVEQSGESQVKEIVLKGYSDKHTLSEDLKVFKQIAEKVVVDS